MFRRAVRASAFSFSIFLCSASSACAHEAVVVTAPSPKVLAAKPPPSIASVAHEESLPKPSPESKPMCAPIATELPELAHEDFDVDVPQIEDPTHEVMAPLYRKLARMLRGKATDHVRIGMYGDSNMTMDWITGHMRRALQKRFGDAGHGFVALAKPWPWYHHMDVKHDLWLDSFINFAVSTAPATDRLIGFAGIAAQSKNQGAVTYVETAENTAPIGSTASHFELYYLQRRGAGTFKVLVDGKSISELDADADETHAGFFPIDVDDAHHKVAFVVTSPKPVRLFGVSMERAADTHPSIVVDSLGCGALSAQQMAEKEDQTLNEEMLAHRKYDLVLDLVGTNMWDPGKLPDWTKTIIDTHRRALPGVPMILMSPPDTAQAITATHSDKRVVKVGEMKRKMALDDAAAFWDFRGAMGGELAIVRFRRHDMAWSDLIHLNEKGASYMADRIVYALWRDFMSWLQTHPDAGCDEATSVASR